MSFKYGRLTGEIRKKYGTQDAFAEVIGMGRVSLNQRLNGRIEWSKDEMAKVMKVLDLPFALIPLYFFEEEVQKTEQAENARLSGKGGEEGWILLMGKYSYSYRLSIRLELLNLRKKTKKIKPSLLC